MMGQTWHNTGLVIWVWTALDNDCTKKKKECKELEKSSIKVLH